MKKKKPAYKKSVNLQSAREDFFQRLRSVQIERERVEKEYMKQEIEKHTKGKEVIFSNSLPKRRLYTSLAQTMTLLDSEK